MRREVGEFEIAHQRMSILGLDILRMQKSGVGSRFGPLAKGGFRSQLREGRVTVVGNQNFGGAGFNWFGKAIEDQAQKHNPARSNQGRCMPALADVPGRHERRNRPVASQQHTPGERGENDSPHGREEYATTLAISPRTV